MYSFDSCPKKKTFQRRSLLSFLSKAFLSYIGNGHQISKGMIQLGNLSVGRRRISQMNLSGGFLHRNGKLLSAPIYPNPLSPFLFASFPVLTNFHGK